MDPGFDSLRDLATRVSTPVSWDVARDNDEVLREMDDARRKALAALANSFADRFDTPLEPHFNWQALGWAITDTLDRLLATPALSVVLYLVSGLHPHE